MKIERIQITAFGKLKDFELLPGDGINIIEGPNESGKSTIASFIRFIFYGLSGKAEGELSPKEKFLSWHKTEASGSLTLANAKGSFRIERAIIKNTRGFSEHLTVVDLQSGAILKNADPVAMFLGGIPEEVFCRTAFVAQADGSGFDNKKITEAIENILSSADESVNTKKAVKKLDDARVMLLYKNKKGGKIYELENERDDLIARAHKAEDDCALMAEKKKLLTDTEATLVKNEEQLKLLEEKLAYTDANRRLQQIEKSRRTEEELQNATEKLDETVSGLLFGDFCPDTSYLSRLSSTEKQLGQIQNEKAKLQVKIDSLQSENSPTGYDIDEDSIKNLQEVKQKADKLRFLSLALLVPALLLDIVAAFTSAWIAIPAGLLLIPSILLLLLSLKLKKQYAKGLADLGAPSEGDLSSLLAASAATQARADAAKQLSDNLRAELQAVTTAEQALLHDADKLAQKWGKSVKNAEELATLIISVQNACRALDAAAEEKKNCEFAYKNLRTEVGENEIAELSEILQNGGSELGAEEYTKAANNRKFYRQTIEMLRKRAKETEHLLIELRSRTEIPGELREKAAILENRIDKLRFCHDAYLLAGQKLQEASSLLRARITPALASEASAFMEHTTMGKYQGLGIADNFTLSYTDGEATRSTEYLSAGTKDLTYLALRLGLIKTLFAENNLPLVFDESFARLDNRRLATVFSYLDKYAKDGGQVLLFTSGKREGKCAAAIGNCYMHTLEGGLQ